MPDPDPTLASLLDGPQARPAAPGRLHRPGHPGHPRLIQALAGRIGGLRTGIAAPRRLAAG